MKKLFFLLACVAMSVLSMAQINQLVWANGRLLYGSPITNVDSLTYDESAGMDTLLLPRMLMKEVHDTVYVTQVVHDTVYVETDCGEDTPSSAGIGAFSVSADKQVTFSPGNLQYHPANDEWRFAENQTDYIGDANANISSTYNGWLDLFGWGTGNNPTNSSTDYNDYQTFIDWGTNQIGSDAPNTWRTLTDDEWEYLLNTRTNASSLKGVAQVNGMNGLIFLPDNWICPAGVTFKSGFHSDYSVEAYGQYQTFSADQWSKLESAGAVFLLAAGHRHGANVYYVRDYGNYWSTTEGGSYNAYSLCFNPGGAIMLSHDRLNGRSVRLVKDIEGGGTTQDTPTNTENGYEYVDLGLSVKWATCNVGASTPEEYGDYFAWGETQPKDTYNWSTYKWCNGSSNSQTKYSTNSSYGTVDNKTFLDASDDAATANWGGSWRMPTEAELTELRTECTWTWTTENGVNGYKVTSKSKGNSIFLPAAGYRFASTLYGAGSSGGYWSSSLYTDSPCDAYVLYFYSSDVSRYDYRYHGQSVRPVCQ